MEDYSWYKDIASPPLGLSADEMFARIQEASAHMQVLPARRSVVTKIYKKKIIWRMDNGQLPKGKTALNHPLFPKGSSATPDLEEGCFVEEISINNVLNGVPLSFHVSVPVGDEAMTLQGLHTPVGRDTKDLSLAESIAYSMPTLEEITVQRSPLDLVPGAASCEIPPHFKNGQWNGTPNEPLVLRKAGADKTQAFRCLGVGRTQETLLQGIIDLGVDGKGVQWGALPSDHFMAGMCVREASIILDNTNQTPVAAIVPMEVIRQFAVMCAKELPLRHPLTQLQHMHARIQPFDPTTSWENVAQYIHKLQQESALLRVSREAEPTGFYCEVTIRVIHYRQTSGQLLYPCQPRNILDFEDDLDVEDVRKRQKEDPSTMAESEESDD